AELRITLSENAAGLVLVGETRSGPKRDVVINEVARNENPVTGQGLPALTPHKELIWSQSEPSLDFAPSGENRSRLLVLEPSTLSLYKLSNSQWNLEQSQPIPRSGPLPTDVRGRLLLLRDQKVEVFLPGQHCNGSAGGGLTLECRQADDPWPIAGENSPRAFCSATRNFFTGVFTGSSATKSSAAFYSAANVQSGGRDIWVFAGSDGRVRQLDSADGELRVAWGSALAGVKSGCGSGWQILASGTGDWTQPRPLHALDPSDGA